jgi:hypothetical protein
MFSNTWTNNIPIVDHNFRTLHENLPENIDIHHHISLHEHLDFPCVDDLLQRKHENYDASFHRFDTDLSEIGHFNKFNYVVNRAFSEIDSIVTNYDYICFIQQDSILINHFDQNSLSLLIDLLGHPDANHRDLGRYHSPPYKYVSHTVGKNTDRERLSHNAALGRGLFPIDRYPLVKYAVSRSQDDRPAEVYLGDYLGEKGLYLQPHNKFYFGDYFLEGLTEPRADRLLEAAVNPDKTTELVDDVEAVWSGALHRFLGYEGEITH